MDTYIEQYQAKHGGVTLHTWTDVHGGKKENFYITGVSGTPVAWWFRGCSARSISPILPSFRRAPLIFVPKGLGRRGPARYAGHTTVHDAPPERGAWPLPLYATSP